MKKILKVNINNIRIDLFLQDALKISRTKAQKMVKNGLISVNNQKINKNKIILFENDNVIIEENDKNLNSNTLSTANECNLSIEYEDEYLMVINKPSGILIYPTKYEQKNTIANQIKKYWQKQKKDPFSNDIRQGICHRIDKDTSGLLIIAKDLNTYKLIQEMLANQEIKKNYYALIEKTPLNKKIIIDCPIKRLNNKNKMIVSDDHDALDALTIFSLIDSYDNFSLIDCEIKTGRTHQIRVHAKYINHPIINDPLYNNKKTFNNYYQYLHAYKIEFIHPVTKKLIHIQTDLPEQFKRYIGEHI